MGLDSGEVLTRDVTFGSHQQIDHLEIHQKVSGGKTAVKSNA